jgi:macrodomain Ter protein organizer (MatP/YcbG family)
MRQYKSNGFGLEIASQQGRARRAPLRHGASMKNSKSKHHINITDATWAQLVILAADSGMSASVYIEQLIRARLQEQREVSR